MDDDFLLDPDDRHTGHILALKVLIHVLMRRDPGLKPDLIRAMRHTAEKYPESAAGIPLELLVRDLEAADGV